MKSKRLRETNAGGNCKNVDAYLFSGFRDLTCHLEVKGGGGF